MWNLKRLEVANYREHLDIAFPAGTEPEQVSEAEKDALLQLYALYEQRLGRPSADLAAEGTREGFRQAIHDAYGLVQDRRRLAKLRAALKLLSQECPYCGFGQIDELDHLLQRGHYKLFSIFSLNLVPCCGQCNRGKRKNPPQDPAEEQLHVYLEDLSEFEFLQAEAQIEPATGALLVEYSINQCDGMDDELYLRLKNHLVEFNLHQRYKAQVNIYLGEQEFALSSTFEAGGADGLRTFLAGTANQLTKRFGSNDWRAALMKGLQDCPEFCEGGFKTALGLKLPDDAIA